MHEIALEMAWLLRTERRVFFVHEIAGRLAVSVADVHRAGEILCAK